MKTTMKNSHPWPTHKNLFEQKNSFISSWPSEREKTFGWKYEKAIIGLNQSASTWCESNFLCAEDKLRAKKKKMKNINRGSNFYFFMCTQTDHSSSRWTSGREALTSFQLPIASVAATTQFSHPNVWHFFIALN